MAKEDDLKRVNQAFNAAQRFKKPLEEKALDYYKLYRSHREEKDAGRSNLFIPYTFSLLETVAPRIVLSLFANTPYLGVIPRRTDSVETAENMQQLVNYQLEDRLDIVTNFADFSKEALMYGSAFGKMGWRHEEKQTKRRVPFEIPGLGIQIGYREKEVTQTLYDDPEFTHIDWFNFYWDPHAKTLDDARFVIHRFFKPFEYLKKREQEGVYENVDAIKEDNKRDSNRELRREVNEMVESTVKPFGKEDKDKNIVEVLEYWEDDRVIAVANRDVVIRSEGNPFWKNEKPFIHIKDYSVSHEFHGVGEIEVVESLQHELNAIRNQRMDNVNLALDKMFLVRRGANIDYDELQVEPGGFIHVDRPGEDIVPLEWPDMTASAYNEEEIVKQDIQFALGIFDYAMGATPERRETATTIVSLQKAANIKFKMRIRMMEANGLRRIGEWLGALNHQFIDREKVIQLTGKEEVEFKSFKPEDIMGEFGYRVRGSAVEPLANKSVRRDQLIQLLPIVAQRPEIDTAEFVRIIIEEFDMKEVEKLFTGVQGRKLEILKGAMETLQEREGQPPNVPEEIQQRGGSPGGVAPGSLQRIMEGSAGKGGQQGGR